MSIDELFRTMMKNFKNFLPILAGLGITLVAAPAVAANFISLPSNYSDTDFNNGKNNTTSPFSQPWQEDWVAEVRGGNNASNGTYELSLNDWNTNSSTTYPATAQNIFTSGQTVDFSVTYDGTNATFLWGTNQTPKTLTATDLTEADRFAKGLDSMFLRLRAKQGDVNNSFELSNLKVNGKSYNGSLLADNSDNLDYLLITGITENFTLTGTAKLSWEGAIPNNSNLDMTIKMGYGAAVPEPLTTAGTLLAGSGLIAFQRKLSQK